MPHLPDTQHPDHDPELIAAYAAGDATGPELERATARSRRARVRRPPPRPALDRGRDAELPAPARTRDFTIDARAGGHSSGTRGIRGLLATLSGPRFSFATPVGTGLAALGIVGVLVASGGGLPASSGTAAPQPRRGHAERPAGGRRCGRGPGLPSRRGRGARGGRGVRRRVGRATRRWGVARRQRGTASGHRRRGRGTEQRPSRRRLRARHQPPRARAQTST